MKHKWSTGLIATGLIAGSLSFAPMQVFAADQPLTILLENQSLQAEVQPIVVGDRTFVPLYVLANHFGAQLEYNAQSQIVTIQKGSLTFTIDLHSGEVKQNGTVVSLTPAPKIIQNRTMVPLRFFAEAFGYQLQYDATTRTVAVNPSPALLQQRQQIKDILTKSQQAVNAQNSYSASIQAKGNGPAGPVEMNVTENLQLDYNKNPLVLHGKGTVRTSVASQQQTVSVEMYAKDGVVYVLDPQTKQWTKMTLMSTSEWAQLIQWSTSLTSSPLQEAAIDLILPSASLKDEGNAYKITYSLNSQGIANLLKNYPQLTTGLDQKKLNDAIQMYKTLQYTLLIDKTTFLQQGIEMQADLSVPGLNAPFHFSESGTISNYGQVPPIQIPQEVLNAKEAQLPAQP